MPDKPETLEACLRRQGYGSYEDRAKDMREQFSALCHEFGLLPLKPDSTIVENPERETAQSGEKLYSESVVLDAMQKACEEQRQNCGDDVDHHYGYNGEETDYARRARTPDLSAILSACPSFANANDGDVEKLTAERDAWQKEWQETEARLVACQKEIGELFGVNTQLLKERDSHIDALHDGWEKAKELTDALEVI